MLAGRPDPKVPGSQEMVTGELEPEIAESLLRQLYRLQFNLANILRSLARFQDARALDEAVLSGQREHPPRQGASAYAANPQQPGRGSCGRSGNIPGGP